MGMENEPESLASRRTDGPVAVAELVEAAEPTASGFTPDAAPAVMGSGALTGVPSMLSREASASRRSVSTSSKRESGSSKSTVTAAGPCAAAIKTAVESAMPDSVDAVEEAPPDAAAGAPAEPVTSEADAAAPCVAAALALEAAAARVNDEVASRRSSSRAI